MDKIKTYIKGLSKRRVAGWFYTALVAVQYLNMDPVVYSNQGQDITLTMVLALGPVLLLGKDAVDKAKMKAKG